MSRSFVQSHPERVLADAPPAHHLTAKLSELVTPLVLESDGAVVPVRYGFLRPFALGSLKTAPLRELAVAWRGQRYLRFRDHCLRAYERVTNEDDALFTNWYEVVAGELVDTRPAVASSGPSR